MLVFLKIQPSFASKRTSSLIVHSVNQTSNGYMLNYHPRIIVILHCPLTFDVKYGVWWLMDGDRKDPSHHTMIDTHYKEFGTQLINVWASNQTAQTNTHLKNIHDQQIRLMIEFKSSGCSVFMLSSQRAQIQCMSHEASLLIHMLATPISQYYFITLTPINQFRITFMIIITMSISSCTGVVWH